MATQPASVRATQIDVTQRTPDNGAEIKRVTVAEDRHYSGPAG